MRLFLCPPFFYRYMFSHPLLFSTTTVRLLQLGLNWRLRRLVVIKMKTIKTIKTRTSERLERGRHPRREAGFSKGDDTEQRKK